MTILDQIFAHKREEIAGRAHRLPLEAVSLAAETVPPARPFLIPRIGFAERPALIAEVKHRSPSRGLLAPGFDPLRLARLYIENGAAAISVLTDERFFGGHIDHLRQIANLPGRPPLLRKDFLCDPYQVYEARAAGADAVLLIVAGLPADTLRELHALALALGMTPLVEVHTRAELETALDLRPLLVGINNRNLHDFGVQLETTLALRPFVPPGIAVVSESGIHTRQDVDRLAECGIDAILVGEAIVTAPDPQAKLRELASLPDAKLEGAPPV